jgi:alpha-ketoglutarate-dependent taurine dioxygenase
LEDGSWQSGHQPFFDAGVLWLDARCDFHPVRWLSDLFTILLILTSASSDFRRRLSGMSIQRLQPGPEIGATFGIVIDKRDGLEVSNLDEEWIAQIFRERGAILFRGFKATVTDFEKLTQLLSHNHLTYKGGGWRGGVLDRSSVNGNPTLLTATGKTQDFPIPLHGEMYYVGTPPEIVWFYCASAAPQGGETTLADGEEFFRKMGAPLQEFFQAHRLKYSRHLSRAEWRVVFENDDRTVVENACREQKLCVRWLKEDNLSTELISSAMRTNPNSGLVFINSLLPIAIGELSNLRLAAKGESEVFPSITVRLDDGSTIPVGTIAELMSVASRTEVPISWRSGDILMVDNTRVMHGRRASVGTTRQVLVRMGSKRTPVSAP